MPALSAATDWPASLSSAQFWMLVVLLLFVLGRVYQASTTSQNVFEALLSFGGPAVLAAAAGGLHILIDQATILRGVTSIPQGAVVSGGDHLDVKDLTDVGDHFLTDAIYVYLVFVLVVGLIFFERQWGASSRQQPPVRPRDYARYVGLGYLIPAFVGVFALYLIYTVS